MFSDFTLRHAARIIKNGGIIAYPTDTIYGLGCDPYNATSVERLNIVKHRPANKQFILLAGNIDQIRSLIMLDKDEETTIKSSKQTTSWIATANNDAPAWLVSNENTITFRISKHYVSQKLCHLLGHAIISTSANISGNPPARNSLSLHRHFHFSVDKIMASHKSQTARPSRIVRLCDNHFFRQ